VREDVIRIATVNCKYAYISQVLKDPEHAVIPLPVP
jgi:hypothetical protein